MAKASRPNNGRASRVYAWHRYLGLAAAILIIIVAVSGVFLNHTERLALDRHTVSQGWLLARYGMVPERPPISFDVDGTWVSWLEGFLYVNGRKSGRMPRPLVGAARAGDLLAAASPDALLLVTAEATPVERLSQAALPGAVAAVGRGPGGALAIRTDRGVFASDADVVAWTPFAGAVVWSRPMPLPAAIEERLMLGYRGEGVPWARVLLDVHSGRILGRWGPYLMDAAAVCLLLLAATGIYNWLKTRR